MAQTLRWYTPQHLARIIVSLARTCAWTQLPARWVPACHTPVVPYWDIDLHTRVPACHEPDRRDKRATRTDYVCILTFVNWLCSLQLQRSRHEAFSLTSEHAEISMMTSADVCNAATLSTLCQRCAAAQSGSHRQKPESDGCQCYQHVNTILILYVVLTLSIITEFYIVRKPDGSNEPMKYIPTHYIVFSTFLLCQTGKTSLWHFTNWKTSLLCIVVELAEVLLFAIVKIFNGFLYEKIFNYKHYEYCLISFFVTFLGELGRGYKMTFVWWEWNWSIFV